MAGGVGDAGASLGAGDASVSKVWHGSGQLWHTVGFVGVSGRRQGDLTDEVAAELMSRIRDVIPVLSVPLVSDVLLAEGPISRDDLVARVAV